MSSSTIPPDLCSEILALASASYCPTRSLNSSSEVTRCMSSSRSRCSACLLFSRDLNRPTRRGTGRSLRRFVHFVSDVPFARVLLTTKTRHWLSTCCVIFVSSEFRVRVRRADCSTEECPSPQRPPVVLGRCEFHGAARRRRTHLVATPCSPLRRLRVSVRHARRLSRCGH